MPTLDEILDFAKSQGVPDALANRFYLYYESQGWLAGNGRPIANWKAKLRQWQLTQPIYDAEKKGQNLFAKPFQQQATMVAPAQRPWHDERWFEQQQAKDSTARFRIESRRNPDTNHTEYRFKHPYNS